MLLRQCPFLSSCVFAIFSWLFESKCRYICISIKCHILFDPFVLAQSFQTLFLSFVPLYISLSIVLFADLVDMSLSFKLLIKNNVDYPEIGESELQQKALKHSTTEFFSQWHTFWILGERLFCQLKIFYYPAHISSYLWEILWRTFFEISIYLFTTFFLSTSIIILFK